MTSRPMVFLDANVLFSAVLGGEAFALVWTLAKAGKIDLVTSRSCRVEAERNLSRKRSEALSTYQALIQQVGEVPDASSTLPADIGLPEKDVGVYAAAAAAGAAVLLTGDLKHFGPLMARTDLPLRVRTVRAFLSEGPKP